MVQSIVIAMLVFGMSVSSAIGFLRERRSLPRD